MRLIGGLHENLGLLLKRGPMQQKTKLWLLVTICFFFDVSGRLTAEENKDKPVILMLIGPPGSGRDLLAVRVSSSYSLPYIACTDLLLDYSDEDSEIGKEARRCLHTGAQIPDSLILKLISERAKNADCEKGFLLDGFPKSVEQATALKNGLGSQFRLLAVNIQSSDEWLINFHEGRLVCTNCGRVYHTDRSPPKNESECDFCGQELVRRDDDCAENLKVRSESYRATVLPLLAYFRQQGLLTDIDGTKSLEEMMQEVKALMVGPNNKEKILRELS